MDLKSGEQRVQAAILFYLLVFVGVSLSVWTWFLFHRQGPHRFPLGERVERYGDLVRFSGKYQIGADDHLVDSEHLRGTLFPKNYPPFDVEVYYFLLEVCAPYAVPVFAFTVLASAALACTLLWRKVRESAAYRWYMGAAIFTTGLFGWGMEQVIMRGNIEGLMWATVCLGAYLYARRNDTGSAVAFGIAACIKPYPILWFALMARQRKYRSVVVGLLTFVVVTLASLLSIDRNPLRAYRHISGTSNFFADYIVSFRPMNEMTGDHSILQTMKTIARVVRNRGLNFSYQEYWMHSNDPLAWKLYHAYLPIAAIVGLVSLWMVWNKPFLNQFFAMSCLLVVLPFIAADYTLSLLLVPMGFLLLFMIEDVASEKVSMSLGKMLWFLLPCAYIMATEPLGVLHGIFKCFAVLMLLGASLTIPLPASVFEERPTHEISLSTG